MIFFYNDENFFHFFHISAFKMKFSSQFFRLMHQSHHSIPFRAVIPR